MFMLLRHLAFVPLFPYTTLFRSHFQHEGDPVPMIDAGGYPYSDTDHPNVETVTLPGPHDGLNFDNHGSSAYYDSIDATGDAHRNGMEQFLVGPGGSADHYTSGVHRDN